MLLLTRTNEQSLGTSQKALLYWVIREHSIENNLHSTILILIIKPTRNTNFSNLFLEYNSTCFGQFQTQELSETCRVSFQKLI